MTDLPAGVAPVWVETRGDCADVVTRGAVVVAASSGAVVASIGDPGLRAYLRSSAKPFQALAFVRRGLAAALGVGTEALAVACASHSGEARHVAAARRLLAAADVPESALLCGTHEAQSEDLRARLAAGEPGPLPIHNNCSGKHAAMLATCRREGWPMDSYPDPEHPLQVEVRSTLALFAERRPEELSLAGDNCTVPTFALPLADAARAAARLRSPDGLKDDLAAAAAAVVSAMTTHPGMVGGRGRVDSDLMEVTGGRILAKTGANGFHLVSAPGEDGHGALGLALKTGAAEGEARKGPLLLACLRELGWIDATEADVLAARHPGDRRDCRDRPVAAGRFVGSFRRP